MRAEWHCSLEAALFRESVLAATALWPALLSRHGVESRALDPVSKARQKAKAETRERLEREYRIIPTPKPAQVPRGAST